MYQDYGNACSVLYKVAEDRFLNEYNSRTVIQSADTTFLEKMLLIIHTRKIPNIWAH